MSAKVFRCLVTIKRADVIDPRFVQCIVDHGSFLVIPVEDYELPRAEGRRELILCVPEQWIEGMENGEHGGRDLLCRKVIDLDRFDELPWVDLPPPPEAGA